MNPAQIADDVTEDPRAATPAVDLNGLPATISEVARRFMVNSGILPAPHEPETRAMTATEVAQSKVEHLERVEKLLQEQRDSALARHISGQGGLAVGVGLPHPSDLRPIDSGIGGAPSIPPKYPPHIPSTPYGVGSQEQLTLEIRALTRAVDKLCMILGAK